MAKRKSESGKSAVIRVIISIIYIAIGIGSVVTAISSLLALNLVGILTSAVGVIMFIAGVLGLLKVKVGICRLFGIIIFIVSAFNFVWGLIHSDFSVMSLAQALLAWLFIACI